MPQEMPIATNEKNFSRKKKFLLTLDDSAGKKLSELRELGIPAAEILVKFYGLEAKPSSKLCELQKEYNFRNQSSVLKIINGVLLYLGYSHEKNRFAVDEARRIQKQVVYLKKIPPQKAPSDEQAEMFKTIQKKLEGTGLQTPPSIPTRHFKTVLCIAEAQANGRLDQLRATHPRLYWVLLTRFGLIGRRKERRYKTLKSMNLADGGRVSCARIWQVIHEALRLLQKPTYPETNKLCTELRDQGFVPPLTIREKDILGLQTILSSHQNGTLELLKQTKPHEYTGLLLRLGLHPDFPPRPHTALEIALHVKTKKKFHFSTLQYRKTLRSLTGRVIVSEKRGRISFTRTGTRNTHPAVKKITDLVSEKWGSLPNAFEGPWLQVWPVFIAIHLLQTSLGWSVKRICQNVRIPLTLIRATESKMCAIQKYARTKKQRRAKEIITDLQAKLRADFASPA